MPTIPKIFSLTGNSVDIVNAIRNNASTEYRNYVPVATNDVESLREIGGIIMDYVPLQNEFITALVNRIGRTILTSKMYENPWAMFKKGVLDFGETIEEIFVDIAKPFEFDPAVAENEVFKRVTPEVRTAFHTLNYQKFYKATINQEQLRTAFLSWDGVTSLIAGIVDSMYKGANYDEFLTMKYMLARHILNGRVTPISVGAVNANTAKTAVTTIKGVSNAITFLSPDYNVAGVRNNTEKNNQYLLVDSRFDAMFDVEVLASAFNMDKAEFAGHRILVDSFGSLDIERLGVLFENDPNYHEFSQDELNELNAVPAVLVDRDWFMIYDMLNQFTENYNGQGIYWNYFYHVWKTFSVSPFANAVAFVEGNPSVTSVAINPSSVSVSTDTGSTTLTPSVETEFFAPKTVVWSVAKEPEAGEVSVSVHGIVSWKNWTGGSFTIRATSTFDPEKYYETTFLKA